MRDCSASATCHTLSQRVLPPPDPVTNMSPSARYRHNMSPSARYRHNMSPSVRCRHNMSPSARCRHNMSPSVRCRHNMSPSVRCRHNMSPRSDVVTICPPLSDVSACVADPDDGRHQCPVCRDPAQSGPTCHRCAENVQGRAHQTAGGEIYIHRPACIDLL